MHNSFSFIPPESKGIFFSGVLGSSLSSLAYMSCIYGYRVAGSDSGENGEIRKRLESVGVSVYPTHSAENLNGYDVLVYSSAISDDNPEMLQARKNGMTVLSRAEFLGGIISEYGERIGVSGTHGKSTVSGMLSDIFLADGRDVTAIIGAESISLGGALRLGQGDTVIYEACEYRRAFLDLLPTLAVVLNIEREHVDCYPTLDDSVASYGEFVKNAGACVLDLDCEGCRALRKTLSGKEVLTFSLTDKKADVLAENICSCRGFYSFDVTFVGNKLFSVKLSVPGLHNVKNALAATAAALLSGVSAESVKRGLMSFKGMRRRLEYVGRCGGADVYDDYAHHPTEIAATLSAVAQLGYERVICAFQPHTYSRTAAFLKEFSEAFSCADEVIFTDIYAAREENVYGVSGRTLADMTAGGTYIPDFKAVQRHLRERASEGTVILTLGAGRLCEVARALTGKN